MLHIQPLHIFQLAQPFHRAMHVESGGSQLAFPAIRIIARHIFPNSVASIVVYATMNIGGAILTESALSFLGLGVVPPDPSWGTLIQEGQKYLQTEPWLMIMPGIAILTTVLAFTLLGDGLRDALDVKMKDA